MRVLKALQTVGAGQPGQAAPLNFQPPAFCGRAAPPCSLLSHEDLSRNIHPELTAGGAQSLGLGIRSTGRPAAVLLTTETTPSIPLWGLPCFLPTPPPMGRGGRVTGKQKHKQGTTQRLECLGHVDAERKLPAAGIAGPRHANRACASLVPLAETINSRTPRKRGRGCGEKLPDDM